MRLSSMAALYFHVMHVAGPWLLAAGVVAYAWYGVRLWRRHGWWHRASYGLGGAVLAWYEVHMLWWIGALGFLLIWGPLWMSQEAGRRPVSPPDDSLPTGSTPHSN